MSRKRPVKPAVKDLRVERIWRFPPEQALSPSPIAPPSLGTPELARLLVCLWIRVGPGRRRRHGPFADAEVRCSNEASWHVEKFLAALSGEEITPGFRRATDRSGLHHFHLNVSEGPVRPEDFARVADTFAAAFAKKIGTELGVPSNRYVLRTMRLNPFDEKFERLSRARAIALVPGLE